MTKKNQTQINRWRTCIWKTSFLCGSKDKEVFSKKKKKRQRGSKATLFNQIIKVENKTKNVFPLPTILEKTILPPAFGLVVIQPKGSIGKIWPKSANRSISPQCSCTLTRRIRSCQHEALCPLFFYCLINWW